MKRYSMTPVTRCGQTFDELQEDPDGEYVSFEEHEAKQAEAAQEDNGRSDFIREAAIRLCVAHRSRDEIWQMSHTDARVVWEAAVALWNSKPEGC